MYLIFVNRQEGSESPQDLCRRGSLLTNTFLWYSLKWFSVLKDQACGPEFDPRVEHSERTNSQNLSSDLHNLTVTHPYRKHTYTQDKIKLSIIFFKSCNFTSLFLMKRMLPRITRMVHT